jgi:hypothetical protein
MYINQKIFLTSCLSIFLLFTPCYKLNAAKSNTKKQAIVTSSGWFKKIFSLWILANHVIGTGSAAATSYVGCAEQKILIYSDSIKGVTYIHCYKCTDRRTGKTTIHHHNGLENSCEEADRDMITYLAHVLAQSIKNVPDVQERETYYATYFMDADPEQAEQLWKIYDSKYAKTKEKKEELDGAYQRYLADEFNIFPALDDFDDLLTDTHVAHITKKDC